MPVSRIHTTNDLPAGPKVSVVIPVYGVEPWLAECLDSVLAQTLTEIEVLCVDDASPDRCGEILDEYAARDSRMRVFHLKENRRQGYGRNLGMDHARGTYIYLLDSDDRIRPEALERLYALAEADSLDGIFFDSEVFYENERLARKFTFYHPVRGDHYEDRVQRGEELFNAMMDHGEWNSYIQRQFWRRAFLEREGIRFPEGVEHEDEVFTFKAVLAAERVRLTHDRFFLYRIRENSVVTSDPAPKNFHGYLLDYDEMNRFVRERGLSSPQIASNLGRIRMHFEQYYQRLHEANDLRALFPEGRPRELFDLFEAGVQSQQYYLDYVADIRDECVRAGTVCIYGAGMIAERVWRGLTACGVIIDRFLVTSAEGNPKALFGRPVTPVPEFAAAGKGAELPPVVIALGRGAWQDVAERLEAAGARFLYYQHP